MDTKIDTKDISLYQLKSKPNTIGNAIQWTGDNYENMENWIVSLDGMEGTDLNIHGSDGTRGKITLGSFVLFTRGIFEFIIVEGEEFLEKTELATGIKEYILDNNNIEFLGYTVIEEIFPGYELGFGNPREYYEYYFKEGDPRRETEPNIMIDRYIYGDGENREKENKLYTQWIADGGSCIIPADGSVKLILDCDNKTVRLEKIEKEENPKD